MAQQVIHRTATTDAEPAAVCALLPDGRTWPDCSPLGSFELLDPGTPTEGASEGVGAIRFFTTGRHMSRERVVRWWHDDQLALHLLGQGAGNGLDLPPPARSLHRRVRAGAGHCGRPQPHTLTNGHRPSGRRGAPVADVG
jgi:hypothetical protein